MQIPPDWFGNILGGLTEAVVGAFLGVLATLYFTRRQQKRKEIAYHVSTIPLLGLTPPAQQRLTVTVDKSVLTNDPSDSGTPVPVNKAYAFEATFRNVGNEDIVNPNIEITLDASAKIVEYETLPDDRPDYQVTKDKRQPNVLYVQFPYINSHDRASITVISIDNIVTVDNPTPTCQVEVRGLGLKAYARNPDAAPSVLPLLQGIIISTVFFGFLVLVLTRENIGEWWRAILLILGVLLFIYVALPMFSRR